MVQKRFIRRGVAQVIYLPIVANPAAGPTRQELEAGFPLHDKIAGIAGFAVTSESVPTPDLGSRFDSSIPGNTSVEDSSITLYDDEASEDLDETFPIGDEAYVYIMRKGDKPATPTGDLYPTRVASKTPNLTTDIEPATLAVGFTITSEPVTDTLIPAAAG